MLYEEAKMETEKMALLDVCRGLGSVFSFLGYSSSRGDDADGAGGVVNHDVMAC